MEQLTPQHSRSSLRVWMSLAHSNHAGNVHGGTILKMVDEAAALAAIKHSTKRVVTAALDQMTFDRPVHVGDLLVVEAQVNQTWGSSMEVGTRVWSENITDGSRQKVAVAYLTMVALSEEAKPVRVPELVLENSEDHQRARQAEQRRAARLAARKKHNETKAS